MTDNIWSSFPFLFWFRSFKNYFFLITILDFFFLILCSVVWLLMYSVWGWWVPGFDGDSNTDADIPMNF